MGTIDRFVVEISNHLASMQQYKYRWVLCSFFGSRRKTRRRRKKKKHRKLRIIVKFGSPISYRYPFDLDSVTLINWCRMISCICQQNPKSSIYARKCERRIKKKFMHTSKSKGRHTHTANAVSKANIVPKQRIELFSPLSPINFQY